MNEILFPLIAVWPGIIGGAWAKFMLFGQKGSA